MALIEMKDIRKQYHNGHEELVVLDCLNLTVEQGDTLIITGESGCGKSTLLNLIGGLDNPTEGSVLSCGYEVSKLNEKDIARYRNQELGFVFQFHYLLKDFNALENISMPGLMAGENRREVTDRAAELLDRVGLRQRSGHYPSQLSGGERQRIVLARALMNDPSLILADEPTGNLDERNSKVVEDILFQLTSELGKTLIVVTHDPSMAKKGKNRLHLTHGEVYADE